MIENSSESLAFPKGHAQPVNTAVIRVGIPSSSVMHANQAHVRMLNDMQTETRARQLRIQEKEEQKRPKEEEPKREHHDGNYKDMKCGYFMPILLLGSAIAGLAVVFWEFCCGR